MAKCEVKNCGQESKHIYKGRKVCDGCFNEWSSIDKEKEFSGGGF